MFGNKDKWLVIIFADQENLSQTKYPYMMCAHQAGRWYNSKWTIMNFQVIVNQFLGTIIFPTAAWWRHHMDTHSALLALLEENQPATGKLIMLPMISDAMTVMWHDCNGTWRKKYMKDFLADLYEVFSTDKKIKPDCGLLQRFTSSRTPLLTWIIFNPTIDKLSHPL